jgi:hypothetical protein
MMVTLDPHHSGWAQTRSFGVVVQKLDGLPTPPLSGRAAEAIRRLVGP